ncbi:hypothetical protein [Mesorhizobium sp.]|uniref:hypothetical protein n=1 Tax=Mesorhizobium sp. TaxID=1871066 RepID=UPI0025F86F42|nr:hypothetical protein [Mesorhizobium sp.]
MTDKPHSQKLPNSIALICAHAQYVIRRQPSGERPLRLLLRVDVLCQLAPVRIFGRGAELANVGDQPLFVVSYQSDEVGASSAAWGSSKGLRRNLSEGGTATKR